MMLTRAFQFALCATLATSVVACGGSQKKDQALLDAVEREGTREPISIDEEPIDVLNKRHVATLFATYECDAQPLQFAADSADLLAQTRTQLRLLSWCVRDYRANELLVAPRPGASDTLGIDLDRRRAAGVAAYLEEIGVDASTVRIKSQAGGPLLWPAGATSDG